MIFFSRKINVNDKTGRCGNESAGRLKHCFSLQISKSHQCNISRQSLKSHHILSSAPGSVDYGRVRLQAMVLKARHPSINADNFCVRGTCGVYGQLCVLLRTCFCNNSNGIRNGILSATVFAASNLTIQCSLCSFCLAVEISIQFGGRFKSLEIGFVQCAKRC